MGVMVVVDFEDVQRWWRCRRRRCTRHLIDNFNLQRILMVINVINELTPIAADEPIVVALLGRDVFEYLQPTVAVQHRGRRSIVFHCIEYHRF